MRGAHSFHDTLVPSDGRFQRVQTHGQLGGRLRSVKGLPPYGQTFGYFVGIGKRLVRYRTTSSGGFLGDGRQVLLSGTGNVDARRPE
jgi:hypothetical protein